MTSISSSKQEFLEAKDEYEKALKDAGCTEVLKYEPNNNNTPQATKKKRKRQRRITWYNHPYSKNVATNIGKEFFDLVRIHFLPQHPLHKLFNKNTIKLSYSCMINMDNLIKAHSNKILRKEEAKHTSQIRQCNCGDRSTCPVATCPVATCPQKQRGIRSHRTTRRQSTKVYRNDGKRIQNEIYEPQSLLQAPYTQKTDRTFKPNMGPQR